MNTSQRIEEIKWRLIRTSAHKWRFHNNTLIAGDKCLLIASQLPDIGDQIFIEEAKEDIKFLLTLVDKKSWPKRVGIAVGRVVAGKLFSKVTNDSN